MVPWLVLLRRLTGLAAAAIVAGVPVALASGQPAITPTSIAGVRPGLTHAAYTRILGKPVLVEFLENNYSRLVFTRRKVEVYFRGTANRGVVVATWNRSYRTADGIGPCSTVAALKAAYGRRLKRVIVGGSFAGYRLGALVFAVDGRVRAVSLKASSAPLFVAIATAPRSAGCPRSPIARPAGAQVETASSARRKQSQAPRSEGRWLARLTKGGSGPTTS